MVGGGNSMTGVTPPAAFPWTLLRSDVSDNARLFWYYIANAAQQSGNQSWAFTGTPTAVAGIMVEYAGVSTVNPLDQNSVVNTGTSTTPNTKIINQTLSSAVCVGVFAQFLGGSSSAISYSTPTNGFAIAKQQEDDNGGGGFPADSCGVAIVDKLNTASGNQSTQVTSNHSAQWTTFIADFGAVGTVAGGGKFFRPHLWHGLGVGGPFFQDPLGG
jgi:hypothetical protein